MPSWAERGRHAPWLALATALWCCGDETRGSAGDGEAAAAVSDSGPWADLGERPCPPDSVLTWENFGASFVLANCTGCHGRGRGEGERQGAPLEVTFDDPASIRMWADRIWLRAADGNATMPPVGAPGTQQRRQFGEWLACDAPTQADL